MQADDKRSLKPADALKRRSRGWLVISIGLIAIGAVAVALPLVAGLATTLLIGWLLVLAAFAHFVITFEPQRLGSRIWHALVAVLYGLVGTYLLLHPKAGLMSLTLLFAVMLIAAAIFRVAAYLRLRPLRGAGWLLLDALLSVVLGLLIGSQYPQSSEWAVGMLIGVSILANGLSGLMFSLAARRYAESLDEPDHSASL
ncbi:MAG: HdeD family acid-resistance protein [Gammaproteobacteria bacterium]|nr:HdeD family acid-resistance protein [Gammaproteobacteria bacterium]